MRARNATRVVDVAVNSCKITQKVARKTRQKVVETVEAVSETQRKQH